MPLPKNGTFHLDRSLVLSRRVNAVNRGGYPLEA